MGGSFRKSSHFVAPSCKLELARFSAYLRIQDGAKVGKKNWSAKKWSKIILGSKEDFSVKLEPQAEQNFGSQNIFGSKNNFGS